MHQVVGQKSLERDAEEGGGLAKTRRRVEAWLRDKGVHASMEGVHVPNAPSQPQNRYTCHVAIDGSRLLI